MVEKALSWALRELAKRDRPAVEAFMAEMDESDPPRPNSPLPSSLSFA
ncbi:MAG: DNA alkylation repair protein [Caldimonas sp.]